MTEKAQRIWRLTFFNLSILGRSDEYDAKRSKEMAFKLSDVLRSSCFVKPTLLKKPIKDIQYFLPAAPHHHPGIKS